MQSPQRCSLSIFVLLCALQLAGCLGGSGRMTAPPPLSSQQRSAMQTKELKGSFPAVFAATISVLQDEGWQLDVVDRESGIIQASSLKRQDVIGPAEDWYIEQNEQHRDKLIKQAKKSESGVPEWTRWERLTAHIEPWEKNTVRERITIIKFGSLPTNTYSLSAKNDKEKIQTVSGKEQSMIVENPATYQYLFQQIQRAIFIREGLSGH